MDLQVFTERLSEHLYTSGSIGVDPNPPVLGDSTTVSLELTNHGTESITVARIAFELAAFGIGVQWDAIPDIGPITLAPSPTHTELVSVTWEPRFIGHQCVRATVEVPALQRTLHARRNLHVIDAAWEGQQWDVPFRVGNPSDETAKIDLALGLPSGAATGGRLVVDHHVLLPGQGIWLAPGEERDVVLQVAAAEITQDLTWTVEGFINGTFIDGIAVLASQPSAVPSPKREHALSL